MRYYRSLSARRFCACQDSSDIWLSQIPDPAGGRWPCALLSQLSNRRFCACWRAHQYQRTRRGGFFGIGAPARTRTWNPRLRRPVLYPVELRARMICWPFGSGESACILHEFRSLAMGSAYLSGIASIVKTLALYLFLAAIRIVPGVPAQPTPVYIPDIASFNRR